MQLYDFQEDALSRTGHLNKVAYYLDMGLGKTFVGSEKAYSLGRDILLICQKSKVKDWVDHFNKYYDCDLWDLTATPKKQHVKQSHNIMVNIINYDIVWRRDGLFYGRRDFTLMLDESSCIQNETSKRTKYICWNLKPENIILLSGTPCNGKYENLYTQVNMLGYRIKKKDYWERYICYFETEKNGYPVKIVTGYKRVDELKTILKNHGAVFMRSDEVYSLPEQVITDIKVPNTKEYKVMARDRIVQLEGDIELVGKTTLTQLLYLRELASGYNKNKAVALTDLLESCTDRLIIFYSFDKELEELKAICKGREISEINGHRKDLRAYEEIEDSVTLVQYQSGAMGLNLQKANKVIFYSPTLSCELYMQAMKRIHRIGQGRTCFYYRLITENSIEEKIYKTLEKREDYTLDLFESEN